MSSDWIAYKYFRNIKYGICSVGEIVDLSKQFPQISINKIQIFFTIYDIYVNDVISGISLEVTKDEMNKSFRIIANDNSIYNHILCKYVCIEGDDLIE